MSMLRMNPKWTMTSTSISASIYTRSLNAASMRNNFYICSKMCCCAKAFFFEKIYHTHTQQHNTHARARQKQFFLFFVCVVCVCCGNTLFLIEILVKGQGSAFKKCLDLLDLWLLRPRSLCLGA